MDNIKGWCCASELINLMAHKFNIGLLLYITHARISAEYLEISPEEYISRLDLNLVKELHLSVWKKQKKKVFCMTPMFKWKK